MPIIRLRTGALACLCLLSIPFLSFAQTDNDPTAAPLEDSATAPSTNAAAASLDRALARAVVAEFSPLNSVFSPDEAQGDPQDQTKPPATNPGAPTLEDLGLSPKRRSHLRRYVLIWRFNSLDRTRNISRFHFNW
jgi:hypothetical protein